jgi:hypothetical protein
MAESLAKGEKYTMLDDEPEYCASTMLSVLEALWKARTELARMKKNEEMARHQLAQASENWWAQCRGEVPVEPIRLPIRPTPWARFKRWLRAFGK